MDFQLSEQQLMIKNMVAELGEKTLGPASEEVDKEAKFPEELIGQMRGLGLFGMTVPAQHGGVGADAVTHAVTLEEVAKRCLSTAVLLLIHNSYVCHPIVKFGTDEQKSKFLPMLLAGGKLGALAYNEPNTGSNMKDIETTATLDGDHWVITGKKSFITAGARAGVFIVLAKTVEGGEDRGVSAFIVERGTPGLSSGEPLDVMGARGTQMSDVTLDNCKVPKENLLGKAGGGGQILSDIFNEGKIGIAAQAVGLMHAALDESVNYSKERVQFGRPISSFQAIQWKLADMATELESAHLLTMQAASFKDSGKDFANAAAIAKVFSSEAAMRAAREAVQIHGGLGYTKESRVERVFRDAKVLAIFGGTSEIQRQSIADELLK